MLAVRSVLIASAVLCVAAHAQPATSHRVPTVEDGAVLTVVGVGASIAAFAAVGESSPTLAVPVAMGAAVLGTSSALGLRPTVPGVLLDTAVGSVAGLATYEVYRRSTDPNFWGQTEAVVVGAAVGAATVAAAHVIRLSHLRGVRGTPAALVGPEGERGAGLRLQVDL
ncbi:hypothetical protein [Rubrivirga marina]|uniref:Uncharacterized protein n=1 Tax=Rubrivirga marina TaxID=1196024 RepID=A0A271IVW0_9BACT|nr:hypothetical protein [Rubrivirga marina]PAP75250.1 hypothetical protein BSZ37_01730 [Rubrivirga marina]